MSRVALLCTVLALPVFGCSGGEFGVAASGDDASTDASSDAGSDATSTDTCAKNACGGCAKLTGAPGDACGCDGKLACGGCADLANPPDAPCGGACGSAKYACDGEDATKCVDPVTTPAPGGSCGVCAAGEWTCADDKLSTFCKGDPVNACGGCEPLAHEPKTPCGVCGSGEWECASSKDAVECKDKVTTPPPGTACGTCNTLKYACAADKLSTVCPGDDANACGGCTKLDPTKLPGVACGKCGSGAYECATSKESTLCDDPVTTPAPGTKCGYCGTSTWQCTLGKEKTVCVDDDDRVTGTDTFHATYSERLFTVAPSEEPLLAISFKTKHAGSITDLSLAFQRFDQSAGALPGSIRVRLIKGTPTSTPAAADVLATISVPGDSVPDVASPNNLKLPVATPNLPANTALWIDIADASERFNFELHGGDTTGPSDLKLWYRDASAPTGWATSSGAWPYLTVSGLGCF